MQRKNILAWIGACFLSGLVLFTAQAKENKDKH